MESKTQFFNSPTLIQELPKKKKSYQLIENHTVDANKAKSSVAVHRCKFLEWQPEGVIAMAYNSNLQVLAVARENCDIELWRRFSKENWWPERVSSLLYKKSKFI